MIGRMLGALLFALTLGNAHAQSCSGLTTLVNGTNADATQVMSNFTTLLNCINNLTSTGALRGYVSGLTLSTAGSSANFAVAAGVATSDDTSTSMALATSLSKTTAAWAVGSGTGALDTGTIANSTWYHVFLVERTDTSVVDILVSLSATGPTLPANYTKKRRIGSMKTNGSSQWTSFVQLGDEFLWAATVLDVNNATIGTSALTPTISVPTGVQVIARLRVGGTNSGASASFLINSPDENSVAVGTNRTWQSQSAGVNNWATIDVRTNTSAQIRAVADTASSAYFINTYGWIDTRGKLN